MAGQQGLLCTRKVAAAWEATLTRSSRFSWAFRATRPFLLLHKPIREVIKLLSPTPPPGSSISAGSWVFKARAPQGPLSRALLWGWSLSLLLAASFGRTVASLDAFFLLTVFLPSRM